jgi:hypothetical protein
MGVDGAPRSSAAALSFAVRGALLLLMLLVSAADATPAGASEKSTVPFSRASSSAGGQGVKRGGGAGPPPPTPRQLHRAVWGPGWTDDDDDDNGGGGGGGGGGGWTHTHHDGGRGIASGEGGTHRHRLQHELWARHRGGMFVRGEGRWRHATLALAKYVQVHRGIVASAAADHRVRARAATTAAGGDVDNDNDDGNMRNGLAGGGGTGGGGSVGGGRHPARFLVWHGGGIAGVPFTRRLQAAASTFALALATGRAFMIDDPVLERLLALDVASGFPLDVSYRPDLIAAAAAEGGYAAGDKQSAEVGLYKSNPGDP